MRLPECQDAELPVGSEGYPPEDYRFGSHALPEDRAASRQERLPQRHGYAEGRCGLSALSFLRSLESLVQVGPHTGFDAIRGNQSRQELLRLRDVEVFKCFCFMRMAQSCPSA
mgnify:FL=1